MFLSDSHIHTQYSFDADTSHSGSVEAYCEKAIEMGFSHICFTDHYEVGYTNTGIYPPLASDQVKTSVMEAKEAFEGRIKVIHGVELGQPLRDEAHARQYVSEYDFEYVICSIHVMKGGLDFSFLDCTHMPPKLFDVLFEGYLEEYKESIMLPYTDTAAHLTYPIRYAHKGGLYPDTKKFYPQFKDIFKCIIEHGKSLEINTSGLRQGLGFTLPDYDIAKIYRECGGELITVGSDAHTCKDLGAGIKEVYSVLRDIGFKYVAAYEKNKMNQIKL